MNNALWKLCILRNRQQRIWKGFSDDIRVEVYCFRGRYFSHVKTISLSSTSVYSFGQWSTQQLMAPLYPEANCSLCRRNSLNNSVVRFSDFRCFFFLSTRRLAPLSCRYDDVSDGENRGVPLNLNRKFEWKLVSQSGWWIYFRERAVECCEWKLLF